MICIILGTRPEIIKMSPIIRECEKQNLDYFVLHTGQHYSYEMDKVFFETLEIPQPRYNLDVGANVLASVNPASIFSHAKTILSEEKTWSNPYGNGNAASLIIEVYQSNL